VPTLKDKKSAIKTTPSYLYIIGIIIQPLKAHHIAKVVSYNVNYVKYPASPTPTSELKNQHWNFKGTMLCYVTFNRHLGYHFKKLKTCIECSRNVAKIRTFKQFFTFLKRSLWKPIRQGPGNSNGRSTSAEAFQ